MRRDKFGARADKAQGWVMMEAPLTSAAEQLRKR
jgi:hypothetical protein